MDDSTELSFEFQFSSEHGESPEETFSKERGPDAGLAWECNAPENALDHTHHLHTLEEKREVLDRIVQRISSTIRENEGEAPLELPQLRRDSNPNTISTQGAVVVRATDTACGKLEALIKAQILMFLNRLPISFNVAVASLIYLDRMQKRVQIFEGNSN